MATERPGVIERLSHAMVSDDLSQNAERTCDVDYLTALGMAGARRGIATTYLQLDLAMDAGSLRDAHAAATQLVRKMAPKLGWALDDRRTRAIATSALHHYVKPACPPCHGRGFVGVEVGRRGTPRPCSVCNGSGKRQIEGKFAREVRAVVARLEDIREIAAREVKRRMRVR